MKILIVEDQPVIAMDLAMAVEALGYEVIGPAGSLPDALTLVNSDPPDMGLLNIDLELAGEGLVIAKILADRGTPALFISGKAEVARRNSALAVGYICKPFTAESVAQSIAVANAIANGADPLPDQLPSGFVRLDDTGNNHRTGVTPSFSEAVSDQVETTDYNQRLTRLL